MEDENMSEQSYSIVTYCAERERVSCGYCKSPNTYYNYGLWAHSLTVQDYQALLDRGWRRSGFYCYKPHMSITCCPAYIIKCKALQFKITKSQKKILKRMTKFLKNELHKDEMDTNEDHHDIRDIGEFSNYNKHLQQAEENISEMNVKFVNDEVNLKLKSNVLDKEKKSNNAETLQKHSESVPCALSHKEDSHVISQSVDLVEMSSSRTPCKKAKLLRIERKQNKLLAQGKTQKEIEAIFKENKQQNHTKSVDELFYEMYTATNRLELKLVRTSPMSSGYLKTSKASYELYKKYQTIIHGVAAVTVTEDEYIRFLVKSPLQKWVPDDGPPSGYGSFHEQYWLDNELIAVAVLDILPTCISSVYFFYDPAYTHLSLGTLSSLREVCLTRELNKVVQNLKDYCMGFYIHTCPKMRYKTRMRPSKLLCPETYAWFDVEACLPKLDKEKYSRLNDDIDAIDQDGIVDINKVHILHCECAMPYRIYKEEIQQRITEEEEEKIEKYARLVGMKCAQSILLCQPRHWV